MNIFKKIVLNVFTIAIILSLFACSVNTKNFSIVAETAAMDRNGVNYSMKSMAAPAPMAVEMAMEDLAVNSTADATSGSGETNIDADKNGRKLIKTVSLNTETKQFDDAVKYIDTIVKEYNGIIDSSYVDSGSIDAKDYRRNANYSIRVPADKLDDFNKKISSKLNVTFKQENVRDVTDTYDDTEAKIKTLKIEVNKLNELLTRATTVEDLIKIEEKLTSVRHELEKYEKKKKNLDKQINYSTISLNVSEVKELSEVTKEEDLSKEALLKKLNKNFEETKKFIIKCGCYIFTHLPSILLGILVLTILILILVLIFRPKKNKDDKNDKNDKNSRSINRYRGINKEDNAKDLANKML